MIHKPILKPAPVLKTYGSTRKSSSAERTAPAAITLKFVNYSLFVCILKFMFCF